MSMQITFCSTKNIGACSNAKKCMMRSFKFKVLARFKRICSYAFTIFYIAIFTKRIERIRRKICSNILSLTISFALTLTNLILMKRAIK